MIWSRVKSYGLVTVITAVIWVFAEAESLRTKQVWAEVMFQGDPSGERVIDVVDGQGWRGRVELTVEGSAAGLDRLQSRLNRQPIKLAPGMDGVSAESGEQSVELRVALRAHPDLREVGGTITKTDPPTVKVRVDQMVPRELRVEVQAPDGELDGVPETRPAKVRVRLPASDAASLGAEATAVAKLDASMLSKLVPGRVETVTGVPVALPAWIVPGRARIEPPSVDVQLKLRSRTATVTVPSVPVQVRIAAVELGKWEIEIPETDRFIRDVKITGPSDLVNQVRTGEIKILATVSLGFEELERGITSKEVTFTDFSAQLPLKFEADNRVVRLTVRKREADAAAGPGG